MYDAHENSSSFNHKSVSTKVLTHPRRERMMAGQGAAPATAATRTTAVVAVTITCVALVVRLGLLLFGEYVLDVAAQEQGGVRYTDVDYFVFTDAARHVAQGQSPFLRHTYRYTPLLAYLCLPNVLLWPAFGKLLFCLADVAVGVLIYVLQQQQQQQQPQRRAVPPANAAANGKGPGSTAPQFPSWLGWAQSLLPMLLWLFNPITIGVSTRGNAESLVLCAVLLSVYGITRGKPAVAGAALGLAVHLKLYPIIYSLPFYLHVSPSAPFWYPTWHRIKLVLACILTLVATTAPFYIWSVPTAKACVR